MWSRNHNWIPFTHLGSFFLSLFLSATAFGQLVVSGGSPGLTTALVPGEIIGQNQVYRNFMAVGTNKFMFVMPEGIRMETPNNNTIVLAPRDMSWHLTIRANENSFFPLGA